MTVIVDDAVWRSARRPGVLFCHVASDASLEELHTFARALGIPERAFHRDHYDVPAVHRHRLLAGGAEAVSSKTLVRRLRDAGLRRRSSEGHPPTC